MPRIVLILLLFIHALAFCVMPRGSNGRFRNLLAVSDYETLITELESLRSRNPKRFGSSTEGYLLARVYEKSGDIARASAAYNEAGFRDDGLERYAVKHLSRIARTSGNLGLERLFLRELVYAPRQNLASVGAARRLAINYFESGDFAAVVDLVETGYANGESTASETFVDRSLETLLASAYAAGADPDRARAIYEKIIESVPDPERPDDYSLKAVEGLDRLDAGGPQGTKPELSASEHMRRADIYQFNRDFRNARLHYEAIIDEGISQELLPLALYNTARGYAQERDDKTAASWFEKLRKEYPEDRLAGPALYGAAGSYANTGNTEKAVRYYSLYIENHPVGGNLERAYLNIVDAYRDSGKPEPGLNWSRKAQTRFRGEIGEAIALFAEAKIHLAAEDWNRAKSALDQLSRLKTLGGSSIAGGTNKSEIRFLQGLVLQNLNKVNKAKEYFGSVKEDWREYYGWRSKDRLRSLDRKQSVNGAEPDWARSKVRSANKWSGPRDVNGEKIEIPDLRRVDIDAGEGVASRLLEVGLFDEAAPEAEIAVMGASKTGTNGLPDGPDQNTLFTIAEMNSKGGYADRAIGFLEPRWRRIPRGIKPEQIPGPQAQLLYPVPFRDSLLKHGSKNRVDPRFILSIMRQESRYRSDIKSAAAARGLMQFVFGTSAVIARDLSIDTFDQDDLYDPDTAVRFGARYLSKIFRDFPDQRPAVAAGYNGGEDRMARWMKRANSDDPDRYVPEIVFSQTKDYTYRVMSNYRMYTYLYDENLLPRKPNNKTGSY